MRALRVRRNAAGHARRARRGAGAGARRASGARRRGRDLGRGGPGLLGRARPGRRRGDGRNGALPRARARGHRARRAHGARAGQGPARRRAAGGARGDGLGLRRGVRRGLRLRAAELPQAGRTETAPAAEPGAARRAKAFADFEAEARARYLEEFSRLATTDDVIGYAWPKPELGPDGLPLPLAARGGAATAPVPERTADEEPALLGSHDRRRAHAETRRRALAAKRRGVFRTGRSSHRGPLMPSIDKIKPLPPRPRDPFAPPRFAVTDVDGSRYELSSRAATSVSHQGGSDAEAAFAREVARDADVETFFDRSIVEAARARPMRGAPRGRQRYNSPYSRRVGPRLRPLEGGGTASVARALASTAASAGARSVASALTGDDFPWPRTRRYRTRRRSGASTRARRSASTRRSRRRAAARRRWSRRGRARPRRPRALCL